MFETLLVVDGRPVELDAHLSRMRSSVWALFGMRVPPAAGELTRDRARGLRLGRIRLTVAPNGAGTLGTDVRVAPVEEEAVFPDFDRAVTLVPLVLEGGMGAHKWADRELLQRAKADAGDALPLLVDSDGTVLEASRGNVFVVQGRTIVTPPADGRILPGVTRARVIALARVREEAVSLDRLLAADEVFLTGAVRGVEPVRAFADSREWAEGRITPLVSDGLRRCWGKNR